MKTILSLLLKIGIPAAIIWALMASNPGLGKHHAAITRKMTEMASRDIPGPIARTVAKPPIGNLEESPYTYHDYFVFSKTTDANGDMSSYGFCGRVFVTKNKQ